MTPEELQVVIECGQLAPSVHNTQPWAFLPDGDQLDVRADPSRRLSVLDPSGRQLRISCGAAVELAYLGARSLDRECTVTLQPDPHDAEHLARLTFGGRAPATPAERTLVEAIPRRYTDRGPYLDRPVNPRVLDEAEDRGSQLGTWLRGITRPDERAAVSGILAEEEAAEAADPAYVEEVATWTTSEAAEAGVPAAALPDWPSERVSDVPLRDFSGHGSHPHPGELASERPPSVERDTLALIGTPTDDAFAWLATGRALGWLLLRATAEGVSAQPLGPATDFASGRARLRRDLGLVGHPQFLLRLGYGTGRPTTHRRG